MPTILEITNALISQLEMITGENKITPSSQLNTLNIDSFSLIELTVFLEKEFEHKFPLSQLSDDAIHSVESLAKTYLTSITVES